MRKPLWSLRRVCCLCRVYAVHILIVAALKLWLRIKLGPPDSGKAFQDCDSSRRDTAAAEPPPQPGSSRSTGKLCAWQVEAQSSFTYASCRCRLCSIRWSYASCVRSLDAKGVDDVCCRTVACYPGRCRARCLSHSDAETKYCCVRRVRCSVNFLKAAALKLRINFTSLCNGNVPDASAPEGFQSHSWIRMLATCCMMPRQHRPLVALLQAPSSARTASSGSFDRVAPHKEQAEEQVHPSQYLCGQAGAPPRSIRSDLLCCFSLYAPAKHGALERRPMQTVQEVNLDSRSWGKQVAESATETGCSGLMWLLRLCRGPLSSERV